MSMYRVEWIIDIEADSPHEAVYTAINIMQDPDSSATVFKVTDRDTSEEQEIDLMEGETN